MAPPSLPSSTPPTGAAQRAAALIHDAFDDYNARFSDITRRARRRFERRDWRPRAADAVARIDLYDACIRETLGRLEALLDDRVRSRPLWAAIRREFATRIAPLPDRELVQDLFQLADRGASSGPTASRRSSSSSRSTSKPAGDPACPGELRTYACPPTPTRPRCGDRILADARVRQWLRRPARQRRGDRARAAGAAGRARRRTARQSSCCAPCSIASAAPTWSAACSGAAALWPLVVALVNEPARRARRRAC